MFYFNGFPGKGKPGVLRIMRIAFLVSGTEHASVYHRVVQYLPLFADQGVESTIITLPDGYYERLNRFRSLSSFHATVVVRKLFNRANLLPLRKGASRLVYDLDDALFMHDSKAKRADSRTRRARLVRMARAADLVVCGNEWIRKHVARWTARWVVIPTVVDTERYNAPSITPEEGVFRMVWIGSRSTLFYLEGILPALEGLRQRIPGIRLRVISDRFPETGDLPVERVPWSREEEVYALRESHVGIMPLLDDDWSRGKCGLKLLQYGAAGIPSVCTPVGVNREIVLHGHTGLHARTPSEWREAILRLHANPKERARMGAAARERVERFYSITAQGERYLEQLRRAAGLPAPNAPQEQGT